MMALCIWFPIPVPFSAWVTSDARYWVILAKRRRSPRDGQKEFRNIVDTGGFSPLSDREYELDFKIGEEVAAGTYQLQWINGTINPGLTRGFNSGTDFPALIVRIKNDKLIAFPDIRDVKLQPAR
jgi:hypothetical protein